MRAIAITAVVILVGFLMILGSLIGTYNTGVDTEQEIIATHGNNEVILSSFYAEIDEAVQVTEMYADDFREIMTGMIQGRYGEEGNQAQWAWVQEAMPNLDAGMYRELQQIVTRNRSTFRANQSVLVEQRTLYQARLRRFPSGIFLSLTGFPTFDMESEYMPVIYEDTIEVFETGVETRRSITNRN